MYTIGIDIGGTSTRVGVIKNGEELIAKESFSTFTNDPQKNTTHIIDIVKKYAKNYILAGIGISSPGPLDLKNGVVLNTPNLPGWSGYKLVDEISKAASLPAWLNNDANIAALAEYALGAGKGLEIVQFVTVSTGLGAGLVIDGKIISGAHGFAQEVANIILNPGGFSYNELPKGALEAECSGTGIGKKGQLANVNVKNAGDVFKAQGKEWADEIILEAEEILSNAFAMMIATVDPNVIVVGGSVAIKNPKFLENVIEKTRNKVSSDVKEFVNIVPSPLDDNSGLIGAGHLAHSKVRK